MYYTAMPYRLRNRTRAAETELTPQSATLEAGGTSSTTLEGSFQEHKADKPGLSKGSKTKRLRSCEFSGGGAETFRLPLAGNTVLTRIRITKRDRQ